MSWKKENGQTHGEAPGSPPALFIADDRLALAQLEAKLRVVRDRVTAVAKGYATGLYLHGEGGVGKSYTVLQQLQALRSDFVSFNSRMTGRGLYDQLEKYPGSIHLMEDMEAVLQDRNAQGVLRSALWAQRPKGSVGPLERPVNWTTHNGGSAFVFTGGIIMIGNQPIDDVPVLRAVKTRIACLHLEVTADELRALMRGVARKGYEYRGKQLEPVVCWEVCEYLIEQSLSLKRSLDMRLLINSFNDRLQWEERDSACHWKDLVAARVRERSTAPANGVEVGSRQARKQDERAIVEEIWTATQNPREQVRRWVERTGKSQATWYRRLAEVTGAVLISRT